MFYLLTFHLNNMIYSEAAHTVFTECITPKGFIASPMSHDNYKRVWSRDAALAGLAAIVHQHELGIQTLKKSVLLLARHQSANGQLPSNVSLDESHVSFGSIAGRVDATSWWIISACWTIHYFSEEKKNLLPCIEKALHILECWEMNGRGLVYTPLGGNWADEYISTGYTLYDQLLRLWALRAFYHIHPSEKIKSQEETLQALLLQNYSFYEAPSDKAYHATAYARAFEDLPYWASQFSPCGYDKRWDMAANALVLLMGLNSKVDELESYLTLLMSRYTVGLLPVFYPVITPEDSEWFLLNNNFSFQFKNHPFQFHNGGSWPIFSGLLALGFTLNNRDFFSKKILSIHHDVLVTTSPEQLFSEYWDIRTGTPGGVAKLCFSASGYLLMNTNASQSIDIKKNLLCSEIL